MCSKVVLPALSRPRKRSFACLFISPKDERTSQTGSQIVSCWDLSEKNAYRRRVLTPVNNPHLCCVDGALKNEDSTGFKCSGGVWLL